MLCFLLIFSCFSSVFAQNVEVILNPNPVSQFDKLRISIKSDGMSLKRATVVFSDGKKLKRDKGGIWTIPLGVGLRNYRAKLSS